jgi:HK97 family phage major capsid protein
MSVAAQSRATLANLMEERDLIRGQHEQKLAEIATREDKNASHSDKELLRGLRERAEDKDKEIEELTAHIEREETASEKSQQIRRILSGGSGGVEADGDGVVYRDFASYARDEILARNGQTFAAIQQRLSPTEIEAARTRLQMIKRVPANTLSSNVSGLIPDQHIAQIFQVINTGRPIVASARQATLERGRLSFPKVTQRPVVAVQATQKTEAGNQGMIVGMEEATASTYLGGGDLSWQAINWSTPDALQLWFDLAAADYALKTESDAADVVEAAGTANDIATPLGATPTYAQFVTAVAAGAGDVYTNSGRMANTLYMAPDRFYYLAGLTSDVSSPFGLASNLSLVSQSGDGSTLRIIVSRGLDSGVMVVGDSQALICAETAGAPVELRAVEPAIGGLEVGIIGAFEAVVVEDEAFSLITTAAP